MDEVLRPEPLIRFEEKDLLVLLLGPSEQKRIVNEGCLTRSSEYIRIALTSPWRKKQERVLALTSEDDVDLFDDYLHYLHGGDFAYPQGPHDWPRYGERLAKLYVLGERMLDGNLRNSVLTRWIEFGVAENENLKPMLHTSQAIKIIYAGTAGGSPARRFLVDVYVKYASDDWIGLHLQPGFLCDFASESLHIQDRPTRKRYEKASEGEEWPVQMALEIRDYMVPITSW